MTEESNEERTMSLEELEADLAARRQLDEDADSEDGRDAFVTDDFVFDRYAAKFLDVETGAAIPTEMVNGMVPRDLWPREPVIDPSTGVQQLDDEGKPVWVRIKPSAYLLNKENGRTVTGQTWWPGRPRIIDGWAIIKGKLVEANGSKVLNTFAPPPEIDDSWEGDTSLFDRLVACLKPADAEEFLDRSAFIVQHYGQKLHGIYVLLGKQRHGKDSLLQPLKIWLGNLATTVEAKTLLDSQFNEWRKSLMIDINETSSKTSRQIDLYEALKGIATSPPAHISMNDKNEKRIQIPNCFAIFVTTNQPKALYFEEGDERVTLIRFFNAMSPKERAKFFKAYYAWLEGGGWKAVIHKLSKRDLSKFNPKADARTTLEKLAVFETIRGVRRDALDAIIDEYIASKQPEAFRAARVAAKAAGGDFPYETLEDVPEGVTFYPPVILREQLAAFLNRDWQGMSQDLPDDAAKLLDKASLVHKMAERGYNIIDQKKVRVRPTKDESKSVSVYSIYYREDVVGDADSGDALWDKLLPLVKLEVMEVRGYVDKASSAAR